MKNNNNNNNPQPIMLETDPTPKQANIRSRIH